MYAQQLMSGCRHAAQYNVLCRARLQRTFRKGSILLQSKEVSDVRLCAVVCCLCVSIGVFAIVFVCQIVADDPLR